MILLLLVSSLFALETSEFTFSNWLHPKIDYQNNTDYNYLNFFSNNDITYLSRDNSTKIYNLNHGFNYNLNFSKKIDILLDVNFLDEKLMFTEELFVLNYSKKINSLSSTIKYKISKYQPSFTVSTNNSNQLSYKINLDIPLTDNINTQLLFSSDKELYDFEIGYDDYFLSIKNILKRKQISRFNLTYKNKNYIISADYFSSKHIIKNFNESLMIKSPFHNDNTTKVYFSYKIRKNLEIFTKIRKNRKNLSLELYENNQHILDFNKVYFSSLKALIGARIILDKSTLDIGISKLSSDYLLSSKIHTKNINTSLQSLFSSSHINNLDIGHMTINTIFINILKQFKNHSISLNISYSIDKYQFTIQNRLYDIINILIPSEIQNSTLGYNKKEALIFALGDTFIFKKYQLSFYVSQHIPLKLIKENSNNSSNSSNSSNNSSSSSTSNRKFKYGGGYLSLNLSIPIN